MDTMLYAPLVMVVVESVAESITGKGLGSIERPQSTKPIRGSTTKLTD